MIEKAVLILTVSEQLFSTLREGPGNQGAFFLKLRFTGSLATRKALSFYPVRICKSPSLKKI
jgi:hypothetical protein